VWILWSYWNGKHFRDEGPLASILIFTLKAQLQERLNIRAGQPLLITYSVFHLKVCQNFPVLENDYCLSDSETVESNQAISSAGSLFEKTIISLSGDKESQGWT